LQIGRNKLFDIIFQTDTTIIINKERKKERKMRHRIVALTLLGLCSSSVEAASVTKVVKPQFAANLRRHQHDLEEMNKLSSQEMEHLLFDKQTHNDRGAPLKNTQHKFAITNAGERHLPLRKLSSELNKTCGDRRSPYGACRDGNCGEDTHEQR
jgi:hypothetical protein